MTINELQKKLAAMNERVIHFNSHDHYKGILFRDRCQANWGKTGDFAINHKAGNFGGTMSSTYSKSRKRRKAV